MDNVKHPQHYTQGAIECWDVIENLAPSSEYWIFYLVATAYKYIHRAPHKGNQQQDYEKAIFCLQRAVEVLERDAESDEEYDARLAAAEQRIREALIKSGDSGRIIEFPDDHTVEIRNMGGHSTPEESPKAWDKYVKNFYERLEQGDWP